MKKLVVSIVLVVCLICFAGIASAATTRYVDDDGQADGTGCDSSTAAYSTIQAAITAASPGDTISVCPGTYVENQILISKSLIIQGAGADITIIDGGNSGIVVRITANDIAFSGFTVQNSGKTGVEAGILLQGVSGCNLHDNDFEDNFVGVALIASTGNTIQENRFDNNYFGIYAGDGSNPSTGNIIIGNTILNSIYVSLGPDIQTGDGIYLQQNCDSNIIKDNTITNNGKDGIYAWKSGKHTIITNTINNNADSGIELMGSSLNTISDNTLTDNTEKGLNIRCGVMSSTDNTITRNSISGSAAGITLTDDADTNNYAGVVSGNYISYNKIHANTLDMNTIGSPIDVVYNAEYNWWGNSSGPSAISDNVDYIPWYVDYVMSTLNIVIEELNSIESKLDNETFGLKEIKNEVRNIETELSGLKGNTIGSSIMQFQGTLTNNGNGSFSGTINAIAGIYYSSGGPGCNASIKTPDGSICNGGFDVYAQKGGVAYVQGSTWTIGSNHDAYSQNGPWGTWYDPDVGDWNQYSLELTPNHWYLRYTVTGEAPISGTLDWATLFAKETDLGTQVGSHGGSAIHGGGAQAWDWDCGWGVEVIPLEFPGFRVIITSVGVNQYKVFLVPSSQDVSTRASQESVDEIKDLLTNNTFGLEEIKNEIKNIESKITGSTIASSTLYFQGTLTYNIDGTFTGVLPMVNEGGTNSGFDIYAKEGSTAWFGDAPGPVWTSQAIGVDHDAWSTYNPDTPDWYQYSLELDGTTNKWAVRNHAGAEASDPWYEDNGDGTDIARGVPMSGTMDWNTMYAAETDTGAYLPTTGTPEIDGGAATHGGGPQAWDMDWSWGTEVVPLEFPGFDVQITSLGDNEYRVSLIPAPEVKLDSRSSQESVDKIFGIVSNETFGLEEIKDEVRSIETEIHNITYGLPALLTSIQNMYNYLQNTINVALTSIQTKVNTLNTANLDATVSSRASQTSVDTVNTNVNTVKNEILDSGHGLTEIKREIKDIEVNITDMRDKINLIYILLTQHCGNNITDFGEQCDDGDRDNGDGCDSNCQLEICGNGIKQGNEQCDDGNSNNNDACLNNCSLASCGDGYKYAVNEQCDKTDLGGASCISLAYDGGSLSCALNCYYDASNCWDAACSSNADCPDQTAYHCVGNNVWKDFKDYYCEHPGQQNAHCEFTETDNQWAVCSLPNVCVPGNAACQPPGPFCGDGIINYTNEQCDYENLDGKSCLDFGFNDGYLSCNATCKFNTSGCCNITCDTHSDCGTNNQAYICTTNDVYQQTTTYSCISGETCSAHCSTVIGTTIIDNCDDATERCVVGNPVCQPIPKNPFNATLVTDLSASMNTTPLNYAKDADKAFVNTALANVNSRVGLVGFSTAVINFHALSDNKTSLINQIDGYAEQAFSCISCGIVKAVNITKGSRKAIVIVANGEANYVIAGFYHKILAKNEAIAKAKDAWEKDGIRVYAIALGNADTDLMQQIASVGNGQYYYSTGANLTTIYESLVVTISSI